MKGLPVKLSSPSKDTDREKRREVFVTYPCDNHNNRTESDAGASVRPNSLDQRRGVDVTSEDLHDRLIQKHINHVRRLMEEAQRRVAP